MDHPQSSFRDVPPAAAGMQSGPGFEPALQPARNPAADVEVGGDCGNGDEEGAEVEVIEASTAGPAELPAAFAIEEVPPGAMAVARRLADDTGHALLRDVVSGRGAADFQAFNNALMDLYRLHGSVEAFTLLFELNTRPFSMIAARIMRMTSCRAELGDILQETFLAIYRYPTRFCPDKPNAFRNWSYSIIRNTVYRHLQISAREGIPVDLLAEVLADEHASSPATETENAESDVRCQRVYELMLCLYADIYERDLKPRDRLALRLVEIDQLGYREAAEALGVRLENFKMIVCRARKKIFQSLVRTLGTRPS